MGESIGWIIWTLLVFFAVTWAWGCRSLAKSKQGLQWMFGVQTFFLWVIAILFLLFEWNKFHILWVAPVSFFFAQALVLGGIPVLSPVILFATRIFLAVILFGCKKSLGDS